MVFVSQILRLELLSRFSFAACARSWRLVEELEWSFQFVISSDLWWRTSRGLESRSSVSICQHNCWIYVVRCFQPRKCLSPDTSCAIALSRKLPVLYTDYLLYYISVILIFVLRFLTHRCTESGLERIVFPFRERWWKKLLSWVAEGKETSDY